jgi:hypothetical protein
VYLVIGPQVVAEYAKKRPQTFKWELFPESLQALHAAFEDSGFELKLGFDKDLPPNAFRLVIGPK